MGILNSLESYAKFNEDYYDALIEGGIIERLDCNRLSNWPIVLENDEKEFEERLNTFENEINTGELEIKYDEKSNMFYYVASYNHMSYEYDYNLTAHVIAIDDESMNNYADGIMDKYTSKLHELCIKSKDVESIRKELGVRYILEHGATISNSNSKFYDVSKITNCPVFEGFRNDVIATKFFDYIDKGIDNDKVLVAYSKHTDKFYLTWNNKAVPIEFKDDYAFDKPHFYTSNLRKLYDKSRKKRKLDDPENEVIESIELQDNIIKEIDSTVNKIASLNSDDREELLSKAKNILKTYVDRKSNIDSNSSIESLTSLRQDICNSLAKLELEITNTEKKSAKKREMLDESKLLFDKIEKIGKTDSKILVQPHTEVQTSSLGDMVDDAFEVVDDIKLHNSVK